MFSIREKRAIADAVQEILRTTRHPELPSGEISFSLHVDGAESWSWADIRNNGAIKKAEVNPWNESQDKEEWEATEVFCVNPEHDRPIQFLRILGGSGEQLDCPVCHKKDHLKHTATSDELAAKYHV